MRKDVETLPKEPVYCIQKMDIVTGEIDYHHEWNKGEMKVICYHTEEEAKQVKELLEAQKVDDNVLEVKSSNDI